MKKIFPIAILILMMAVSCNNAELEQLKTENAKLKSKLNERNEDINNFMQTFNDIEENLAQVRMKENLIAKHSGNNENGDRVEMVKNDIRAIDKLMQENRDNLQKLSGKLKASSSENNQLQRMINNLEVMIKDKDREIMNMVSQLEDLSFEVQDLYSSISDLKLENMEQDALIHLQKDALNTAWYIIGTQKELMEQNIITKEGGLAGIGAVKTMAEDINQDLFTKIDIRATTVFPIDAKKVNVVTTHPSDSYIIRRNEESKRYYSFEITRPELFWKTSKFMVLSIKE